MNIINKIQKNIKNYFNLYLFLSILLTLSPFGNLSGNEELYYGLANKFLNPNWNGEYSSFILSGDYRFISDTIIGLLLKFIGFENTQIVGSIFTSLIFTHAIIKICKTLEIANFYGILSIVVFILLGQSFIGREWLFEDFEAKIFAYYFVILAIDQYIKNRNYKTVFLLSIATYFHILVGAAWLGLIVLAIFWSEKNLKFSLKIIFIYFLACCPITYLAINGFNSPNYIYDPSIPSPNYIYSYIRQYKMVVPFYSVASFVVHWLPGITLFFGILISTYLSRRFLNNSIALRLNNLILSSTLIIFIFLVISFFDNGGVFAKIYPYRFTSLLLLLIIFYSLYFLKNEELNSERKIGFFLLISIVPFFLINGIITSMKEVKSKYFDNQHKEQLYIYLSNNSLSDEIILIDSSIEEELYDLERKINRPTLITFKYIPTSKEGLVEWYKRKDYKSKIFLNKKINNADYTYNYLIISNKMNLGTFKKNFNILYSNEKFTVLGKSQESN